MKNLFKEAHKLTKEIKAEFPEVDYKAQFGICLSYLQEKEDNKVEKLTWSKVVDYLNAATERLGMDKCYSNPWKKGNLDRTYMEMRSFGKRGSTTINCGYWDNVKEEYVSFSKYKKQYDVIKKEYV